MDWNPNTSIKCFVNLPLGTLRDNANLNKKRKSTEPEYLKANILYKDGDNIVLNQSKA